MTHYFSVNGTAKIAGDDRMTGAFLHDFDVQIRSVGKMGKVSQFVAEIEPVVRSAHIRMFTLSRHVARLAAGSTR